MDIYYPKNPKTLTDDMKVMEKVHYIVIHHTGGNPTATPQDIEKVFLVDRKSEGFSAIGYHFILYPDGRVVQTRPIDRQGGHVAFVLNGKKISMNDRSIGISLVGNYNLQAVPEPMWGSLKKLTSQLCTLYKLPSAVILPHTIAKQLIGGSGTYCPGAYTLKEFSLRLSDLIEVTEPYDFISTEEYQARFTGEPEPAFDIELIPTKDLINELHRRTEEDIL